MHGEQHTCSNAETTRKEFTISKLKIAGAIIAVPLALGAIGFAGQAMNLWSLQFWGPKYEEARRNIDSQSIRRVQGVSHNIVASCTNMKLSDDEATRKVYANLIVSADGRSDTPLTDEATRCVLEAKHELGI